ncbi:GDSL esterase/lipase At5g03610-like isoform X1 [Trifolium pratense]|uniref:GDSL esterase/lipase At5g03610-like isoform X1 n=1 Tax=Trifolium pratense TaxID=57577 RepID=UPI001E697F9A|nr:GDSL esterase/lipase At5g03610-like isoform X1 [Trifolium pratense]
MDSHNQLFILLCVSLLLLSGQMGLQVEAGRHHLHHPSRELFIFGDSYVDTGNTPKSQAGSWKQPYGITFPQKPAGRFSDGRVLSDFIAKTLGLRSPIPYKFRKIVPKHYLKYGMNFAYGGTGVFDTSTSGPNMTAQIDSFNQLIQENVYTPSDLSKSIAYVSVSGNDYNFYLATNGSLPGFPSFIASVVKQTTADLIHLQSIGFKRIVVGALQPLGCLPLATAQTSFQSCNSTFNDLVTLHNNLLNQSVTKLNQESNDHNTFTILDLFDGFRTVLNNPSSHNIKERLKPCCFGVSSEYNCGSVDENNVKKYLVCENPESTFFWDRLHPTQAGWNAVYSELEKKGVYKILY